MIYRSFTRGVGILILSGFLTASVAGLASMVDRNRRSERKINERDGLYKNVSGAIYYLDGEPGTSDRDCALAYRNVLGENYDPRIDDPRKLNDEQLEQIRARYSEKLETVINSDNNL